jgi:hypothetical protein
MATLGKKISRSLGNPKIHFSTGGNPYRKLAGTLLVTGGNPSVNFGLPGNPYRTVFARLLHTEKKNFKTDLSAAKK